MAKAKLDCVVYWLKDESCVCSWRHGYVGISQRVANRLISHRRSKRFPPDFQAEILFKGTLAECAALEHQLRPSPGIGWNLICGGLAGDRFKGLTHTPQGIKRISAKSLKFWSDPANKERMRLAAVEHSRKPEAREHRSCGSRNYWSNPEARKRQSEAMKGRKLSAETIERLRIINTGRKNTPEMKERIRVIARQRLSDPAERARISALTKAAMADPVVRARISAGLQGKPRPPRTPETKERMRAAHLRYNTKPGVFEKRSAAMTKVFSDPQMRARHSAIFKGRKITWGDKIAKTLTGHVRTEESRAKQGAKMRGVPKSPEHREKIRQAALRRYANNPKERERTSEAVKRGLKNADRSGANNPRFGKPVSEATKQTMRDKLEERGGYAGERNPNYRHGRYSDSDRDT